MKSWDTVAIVGVGLIGGSIGLALRRRGLANEVIGVGRNQQRLQKAVERGAVTRCTTDMTDAAAAAQLIVICTPVGQIVDFARTAAQFARPGTLITDAGSTKGEICRRLAAVDLKEAVFVGSHPMAGSEKGGVVHADAALFQDCLALVTPVLSSAEPDIARTESFWQSLGARVQRIDADQHDRAIAAVSHLPHLVAAALAAATQPDDLPLAATGWSDTTRVAAGDPELWRQIFSENRSHVLQALDKFEKVLADFRRAMAADDDANLLQLLELGKQHRDALGS